MKIKEQISDAVFMYEQGRYYGCLSILMLAIAASSRKVFTKAEVKEDGVAFTRFLGGRIGNIVLGSRNADGTGHSSFIVSFRGENYPLEKVLYKFYRCELIHSGDLPEDVIFAPDIGIPTGSDDNYIRIPCGTNMILDFKWLQILIACVTHAECNGSEFGIKHYRELPRDGRSTAEVIEEIAKRFDTSRGRVEIMSSVVYHMGDRDLRGLSDLDLSAAFLSCVNSGKINGGAVNGLSVKSLYLDSPNDVPSTEQMMSAASTGFCTGDGVLTPQGIKLLRDVASRFVVREVGG